MKLLFDAAGVSNSHETDGDIKTFITSNLIFNIHIYLYMHHALWMEFLVVLRLLFISFYTCLPIEGDRDFKLNAEMFYGTKIMKDNMIIVFLEDWTLFKKHGNTMVL